MSALPSSASLASALTADAHSEAAAAEATADDLHARTAAIRAHAAVTLTADAPAAAAEAFQGRAAAIRLRAVAAATAAVQAFTAATATREQKGPLATEPEAVPPARFDAAARQRIAAEAFRQADLNGNGVLEDDEVIEVVFCCASALELKIPANEKTRELLRRVDKNQDGVLQEAEFSAFFEVLCESALKHLPDPAESRASRPGPLTAADAEVAASASVAALEQTVAALTANLQEEKRARLQAEEQAAAVIGQQELNIAALEKRIRNEASDDPLNAAPTTL